MILAIGEILFDIFPHYRRIGGAPFNFAYHLRQLGYDVRFISRVGRDAAGREILGRLAQAGFHTGDLQIDASHPTGEVRVSLDAAGSPTFDIRPAAAYDFIDDNSRISALMNGGPKLIYFGSLIQRTSRGFHQLHRMLTDTPDGSCFFYDMNLRQGCAEAEIIRRSLERSRIVKLNDAELTQAGGLLGFSENGADLAEKLIQAFDMDAVVLTLGAEGSRVFAGGERFQAPAPPPEHVQDTVGAGDAYAAMLAAGLLLGGGWEDIMTAAARFASKICGISGAIPDDDGFYEEFKHDLVRISHAR